MNFGFDLDDVVFDTSKVMKRYVLSDPNREELISHMVDVMRGDITVPVVKQFIDKNVVQVLAEAEPKPYAVEVIRRLMQSGDQVSFITTRGEKKMPGTELVTLEALKRFEIPYTDIEFDAFEKGEVCKKRKIEFFSDDSIQNCADVARENIRSVVFTSTVNRQMPTILPRVEDWQEMEQKIRRFKEEKAHGRIFGLDR